MTLAVDGGWGGKQSASKRGDLFKTLIDLFAAKDPRVFDENKLADFLAEELASKFNVDIEDESDLEVAQLILQLYRTLSAGDKSLAAMVGVES